MANSPQKITSECLWFLKSQTTDVILFYSGGKDSLCLLDMLTKYGFNVHCCFMYMVKGLEHIDKYLNYARDKYKVEVLELPHFNLTSYINSSYYTFPRKEPLPVIKQVDVERAARKHFNCEWVVYGSKASDSMIRNFMMKSYLLNSIHDNSKHAYPLSAWKMADVVDYNKKNNLPTPINYDVKTRSSGLGLDGKVLLYLQKNYPQDLKKILEVFPFAEALIYETTNATNQTPKI